MEGRFITRNLEPWGAFESLGLRESLRSPYVLVPLVWCLKYCTRLSNYQLEAHGANY